MPSPLIVEWPVEDFPAHVLSSMMFDGPYRLLPLLRHVDMHSATTLQSWKGLVLIAAGFDTDRGPGGSKTVPSAAFLRYLDENKLLDTPRLEEAAV